MSKYGRPEKKGAVHSDADRRSGWPGASFWHRRDAKFSRAGREVPARRNLFLKRPPSLCLYRAAYQHRSTV